MCGICGQYNFRHLRAGPAPGHRSDDQDVSSIEAPTTKATTSPDRSDSVFAGSRSSILQADISRCRIRKNPSGWSSMARSTTFLSSSSELEAHGHVFRTNSDTEVIVHGYKQWGDEVLNRLNGMFGLAIWDVRQRRLVLARDPFGIKLLYYRIDRGIACFSVQRCALFAQR